MTNAIIQEQDFLYSDDVDTRNFVWSFHRSNGEVITYHSTEGGNTDKVVRADGSEITDSDDIIDFLTEFDGDFDRWWDQQDQLESMLVNIKNYMLDKEAREEAEYRAYHDRDRQR